MPQQWQRTGSNPVKVNAETHGPIALLRYQRMGRVLRLTDQMLSGDIDSLSIVEGGQAPAWTSADGAAITIDASKMPSLVSGSRRNIAVWLGTNGHELFHNQFTPRADALLMRRIYAAEHSTDRGIHRSWNVLEDQRIERLGLARYAPWRGYLIAALSYHIPVAHPQAWPLVAGRTWLSDEVRAIARASFVATNGEADAKLAAQLIGAYQRLADPGDDDAAEAWDIVSEFHARFGEEIPARGGCGGNAGEVEEGEPEPGDDASNPYPTADEADDDEPDDDDESDEGDDESDDDESDEGDESSDDESDEDGDEGDDGDDDDGSDEGDGSGDNDDDESDEGDDADDDGESDDGD